MTIDTDAKTCFVPSADYPHGWVIHPISGKRLRLLTDAQQNQRMAEVYYSAAAVDEDRESYKVTWETTAAWDAQDPENPMDEGDACNWDDYEVEDC